jgi:hypothetical protein
METACSKANGFGLFSEFFGFLFPSLVKIVLGGGLKI